MYYQIIQKMFLVCYLFSLVAVTGLQAQDNQEAQATINAKVVDTEGQPMAYVLVSAINSKVDTFTDSEGNFKLSGVSQNDRIVIDEPGYELKVVQIRAGSITSNVITLEFDYRIEGNNRVTLPYRTLINDRTVSAVADISGRELDVYPTGNILEALAGRLPGVVAMPISSLPGEESVSVTVRGEAPTVYIDGFERTADNLTAKEVERIQVFKDLSSRAALGVAASGPIIWITTREGKPNTSEMNITTEMGINTPTIMPEYLGAYDYARLYNEALQNDGRSPIYSQEALDAYRNNSDPARYPNVDYYNRYVNDFSSYRSVNVNFAGVKESINYFGYIDYNGSSGLEKIGEKINSNRFKLRGNVNFPINSWIDMGVRVSGAYKSQRYPNVGSGSGIYNMFSQVLSQYPSNSHPITYNDRLIVSDDYPTNLTNELVYGGYGENQTLTSQNDAELLVNLNEYITGLTFKGVASFNAHSAFGLGKGGTEALFRFVGDSLVLVTPRELDPTTSTGNTYQESNTAATAQLNYDRTFGDHALALDAMVYRGVIEEGDDYQPEKRLDYSFRTNYAFDNRYVLQLDLTYSGSMLLPDGERFNLYPSAGVAWIASNESFLENSTAINYLKFYASAGKMGINELFLPGFNPYYLWRTTWSPSGNVWFGVPGNANSSPITVVEQLGNENIELPVRENLNVGVQSRVFDNKLSFSFNYFTQRNTGLISTQQNLSPMVIGGTDFLPAVNFGETKQWGFDGSLQFTNRVSDFSYSLGGNAVYTRGEFVRVDEPQALAEYRKLAGKDMDLIWGYNAEGLFQDQNEIDNRNVSQSWGTVQPGDIRYEDYNDDGIVDEQDVYASGTHSPRLFYGVNLSLGYKGWNLYLQGNGVADGTLQLNNPRYFRINGQQQNYSELLLDRWTSSNTDAEFPRLTTSLDNNVQNSTFWNRSAAYFRLSNLQMSYTLPTRLTSKTIMHEWKLFVRGKNLFVSSDLTKYNVDPGNTFAGTYSYPLYKTITAGISVKL